MSGNPKINIIYALEATGGGALKHLVYLCSRLNPKQFQCTVLLSNSRNDSITEEISFLHNMDIKVILIPMCRNLNLWSDFRNLIRIMRVLKANNFQIAHAHSSKAGGLLRIAAWICNIKLVFYTPHCFYFQSKKGVRRTLYIYLERLLARITHGIIVSESEHYVLLESAIAPEYKVVEINNAIDFNEYQQYKSVNEIKDYYGIPKDSFVVGAVGRLAPQKDWDTYIYAAVEVLKKHSKTYFLIAGDGELKSQIQQLIVDLEVEDNIILTGYVNPIHRIYSVIDVFVNTSLWEGLPYSLLEAMQFEKPIVATNTGNQGIILNEISGYITPVKDYVLIARNIVTLLENNMLAKSMGKRGNAWLNQKYSFELFIKQHEILYRNACLGFPISSVQNFGMQ